MQKEKKRRFLRAAELAEMLSVPRQTIYYWIKRGRIPAYRIGKLYFIPEEEFNALLKKGKVSKEEMR